MKEKHTMALPPPPPRGPFGPPQDVFSLQPSMHSYGRGPSNRVPIVLRPSPLAPNLINDATQPSTLRKVLGKEALNARHLSRSQPVPSTDALVPSEGRARHERKGLAFGIINTLPLDGPLMPIADSDYAYMNSKIQQPK